MGTRGCGCGRGAASSRSEGVVCTRRAEVGERLVEVCIRLTGLVCFRLVEACDLLKEAVGDLLVKACIRLTGVVYFRLVAVYGRPEEVDDRLVPVYGRLTEEVDDRLVEVYIRLTEEVDDRLVEVYIRLTEEACTRPVEVVCTRQWVVACTRYLRTRLMVQRIHYHCQATRPSVSVQAAC